MREHGREKEWGRRRQFPIRQYQNNTNLGQLPDRGAARRTAIPSSSTGHGCSSLLYSSSITASLSSMKDNRTIHRNMFRLCHYILVSNDSPIFHSPLHLCFLFTYQKSQICQIVTQGLRCSFFCQKAVGNHFTQKQNCCCLRNVQSLFNIFSDNKAVFSA